MGRQIQRSEIIDYDETYNTVSAVNSATTEIMSLQLKPGKRPYLIFVGNAISSGGGNVVKFKLQVNQADFYPFDGTLNQWAPPESNYDIPVPLELPTSCSVRVVAVNSDATNSYDATARVRIVYVDFDKADVYK